jgi:glutathione synthase/RimK-type ligase-like ATP-grasp enzyme
VTPFLLYHRRSRPTGQALGAALQMQHGLEVPLASATGRLGEVPLIRWGSRAYAYSEAAFSRVLNKAAAIECASNKYDSLALMESEGVRVPEWDTDPAALVERVGFPILGRRTHHARGTDVVLCLQRRDYERSRLRRDYYVQYVPTSREYRLHVVGDECIRVQGKYLDYPRDWQPHIRNYASGYRFRAPSRRLRPDRIEAAVAAVKALGLDFGAVDLIVGDDDQAYVLEVNTAPSCSPRTALMYCNAFTNMLGLENEILMEELSLLSPDQEEQDTEDEVPGEDVEE